MTASGTLDGRSAEHLGEMLRMVSDAQRVIIDLEDVDLVDVAGLSALVGAIGQIRAAGADVELVATPRLAGTLQESGVRLVTQGALPDP